MILKLMNHDTSNVEVNPHFSTGENLLKKMLRKYEYWLKLLIEKSKYWYNELRKAFW